MSSILGRLMIQDGSFEEFDCLLGAKITPIGVLWAQILRFLSPTEWISGHETLEEVVTNMQGRFSDGVQFKIS